MLGLRFCARAFSSCNEQGPLFVAVRGPLTMAASLVAEHRLETRSLSNCGSQAQLLRGMWDLPRPGLEPVSPALAGRFSTTAPPGKPMMIAFKLGVGEQAENIPPQKRQFMILVISAIKNLKQGEGAREYWGRGRGYYFTYEGLSGRVLKEVKKRAWKYLEEEHSRQQK